MTVRPGLFAAPGTAGPAEGNRQRQTAFLQFKSLTVPLLDAARLPPAAQSTRLIVQALEKITALLRATPAASFSPALANYVFFPLSSLLRPTFDGRDRGDLVLEATMQALSVLVDRWRAVGMEPRVRQELWIMTALTLGGPLDPAGPGRGGAAAKGKGKAIERTEEAQLAMVGVLLALMRVDAEEPPKPQHKDGEDDPLGERIDWSKVDAAHPGSFDEASEAVANPSPPIPILFHTLTTLLALAVEPTSLLQLQLSSIGALQILLVDYLARPSGPSPALGTPSPLLATALPGTASTLSRISLSMPSSSKTEFGASTRRQASGVIVAALRTLAVLIVAVVSDVRTSALREGVECDATSVSLEELVEDRLQSMTVEGADVPDVDDAPAPPPPDPPCSAPPSGPTVPTASWLRYTLTSLRTLFSALSPLGTHDSPLVRATLVELFAKVLADCAHTLGEHAEVLLEGLLSLASDDWDSVRDPARRALLTSFALPIDPLQLGLHPLTLSQRIAQRRLASLPGALRRQDEHAVRRGAGIIRSALELLPPSAPNSRSSSPLHGMGRWSWTLLGALDLERVPAAGRAVEGGMALAWITDSASGSSSASTSTNSHPPIRLRGISEASTVAALEALWESLGRAAVTEEQEGEVVDQFLGVALGPRRGESIAVSALWVLDGVLRGFCAAGEGSSAQKKAQKKLLRQTVRAILALLEDLEVPDEPEDEPTSRQSDVVTVEEIDETMPPLRLVEHKKGVTDTPSLDSYKPVAALVTTRESRASHVLVLSSLSLRLLATSASLLAASFQPFLMHALYHVLAHLSPTTHAYLRAHAQHALALITLATAHESPEALVLANVDYVVNSVSQRLSVSRLEPQAPLVLVEMIRLVGKPIVPMVQDLVDDVFEALDDYHGYEQLTVGLWAVLDALLKVMVDDVPVKVDEPCKDLMRVDPADDWKALEHWLAHRHDEPEKTQIDVEEEAADDARLPHDNPKRPFDSGLKDESAPEDSAGATPSFSSDAVAPPTRPQRITAQIVSKAVYFLSHPSPFLRARVLSLLSSSVVLLTLPDPSLSPSSATREADLLPVLHRAWPFVLARLAPPPREPPPVLLAAVELVERLSAHVGPFLARRFADDVWPRLRALLAWDNDAATGRARGLDAHSESHRLCRAVLCTLERAARCVPLKEKDVWDMALALRRFLVPRRTGEEELRALAERCYDALAGVNADAVWVVLRASTASDEEREQEGLPRWLKKGWAGVEWGDEVRRVLQRL
ncbi:Tti1p [Rhodotorula paludigena]|uniref:Tti1p n=1 Tax=Rhodotorula paludigena TaxID=86838 RepID=UPI003179B828